MILSQRQWLRESDISQIGCKSSKSDLISLSSVYMCVCKYSACHISTAYPAVCFLFAFLDCIMDLVILISIRYLYIKTKFDERTCSFW